MQLNHQHQQEEDIAEDMDIATANMEEDSAVPKVATEVATSVIQTGSSRGGYREERVMKGGEAVGTAQSRRQSTKERTASICGSYEPNNCCN
jgi:CO dehydrogenase/acetyl-CoA synthase delta subunit